MIHNGIKKQPVKEWEIEKHFLRELSCLPVSKQEPVRYAVRKDNSFSYKGNFYSLPLGTYKGKGSQVEVVIENRHLAVYDLNATMICRHIIAIGKGHKMVNTDHKRNKSSAINELMDQVCALLNDPEKGRQFLKAIHKYKPRYIRDQILLLKETILKSERRIVDQALDYCCENHLTSAADFKSITEHYTRLQCAEHAPENKTRLLNPLNGKMPDQAFIQPQTSSINDYDMF